MELLNGRYALRRKLGEGGMGEVWEARDTGLDRAVAVKLLGRGADPRRFSAEGRTAASVNHPNVVAVYDSGDHEGRPFLVMELVAGYDAGDRVRTHGPYGWEAAARLMMAACRGVAAIHSAGLVHRDIKPSNLLVGEGGGVKVTDFGIAKPASSDGRTLTGSGIIGTPHFMSPEQCQGEAADARSDVYALGATFYALLTGRPPFAAESDMGVLYAHCNAPRPDPRSARDDIPEACAAVVRRAMSRSAADRYRTAADMADALDAVLAGATLDRPTAELAPVALPPKTLAPVRSARPTRRALWVLGGAAVAGGAALIAWWNLPGDDSSRDKTGPVVPVRVRNVDRAVSSVAVSADGRWLAVGFMAPGKGVRLYDRTRGDAEPVLSGWPDTDVFGVALSGDGERLAVAGSGSGRAWLWSRSKRAELALPGGDFKVEGNVTAVALTADGDRLAAAVDTWGPQKPGLVRVWDLAAGRSRDLVPSGLLRPRRLAFGRDGKTLAAGLALRDHPQRVPGAVDVWDAADGRLLRSLPSSPPEYGPLVAFAAAAPRFARSQAAGKGVRVSADDSFDPLADLPSPADEPTGLALSADGTLAAVAESGRVYIWDLPAGGKPTRRAALPDVVGFVRSMVFADGGRTLVSGNSEGKVFETPVPPSDVKERP